MLRSSSLPDRLSSLKSSATTCWIYERFFADLPKPIDVEEARRSLDEHLWLPINVALTPLARCGPAARCYS